MENPKNHISNAKAVPVKRNSRKMIIGLSTLLILIAVFFLAKGLFGPKSEAAKQSGDIQISKSEITETAKFIPYTVGGTNMELIAVKAPDGTVRTAFNTCQVCYNSGRGYYKQEGSELVCQNCGNRFQIGQIEQQKNGCNPVPILDENKTDNGTTITITQSFLDQNKELFSNWKKG